MRMRGSQWASVFVFLASVSASDMSKADVNFLTEWEFSRNGTGWQKVEVPHDWAIVGPFDREIDRQVVAIKQNGEKVATEKTGRTGSLPWIGSGEYRRRIAIPKGSEFASLVFDGVMSEPEVFFDGKRLVNGSAATMPLRLRCRRNRASTKSVSQCATCLRVRGGIRVRESSAPSGSSSAVRQG